MKTTVKVYLMMACFIAAAVSAQAHDSKEPGTDTGNGGGSHTGVLSAPRYDRVSPPSWCNDVQGWMADAVATAKYLATPAKQRAYMVSAIESILDAYEMNSLPFQPLTYSLLSRALELNNGFPACGTSCDEASKGNRVATLVLSHMLNLGIKVNADFDMPRYLPYYESHRDHRDCRGCTEMPAYDFSSFYVDYIANVREVLGTFFGPAFERNSKASLLEAMAVDEWELRAQHVILDWVVTDIRNDLFGRAFACVASRLDQVKAKLADHLKGRPTFDDMYMVQYVRSSLVDVLDLLEHSEFQENVYHCHRSRR